MTDTPGTAHLEDPERHVWRLEWPRAQQGVAVFPGDGTVTTFHDGHRTGTDHWTPVQRAVMVARLRTIADQIEQPSGDRS